MSRCFPYPPPGYVKIGIRDEAQTESIKLKREEEKARKERKKEKKREKKEKERAKEGKEAESKKHSHKKRHRDEKSKDPKGDDPHKRRKTELENSDKSTLTEEHEPAAGSQNSSDSTLNSNNSNKRQKESPPSDNCLNSGVTVPVRIMPTPRHKDLKVQVQPIKEQPPSASERISGVFDQQIDAAAPRPGREPVTAPLRVMPTQRHKELKVQTIKEQPPSSLERINGVFDQHMDEAAPRPGKEPVTAPLRVMPTQRHKELKVQTIKEQPPSSLEQINGVFDQQMDEAAPRLGREPGDEPCTSSQTPRITLKLRKESPFQTPCASERSAGNAEETSTPKLCSRCPPALALQFKSLVEDWIQPPTENVGFEEDQDWLLQTTRKTQPVVKRTELGITSSSRDHSDYWPRACHLPDVDIYALPFTIPF